MNIPRETASKWRGRFLREGTGNCGSVQPAEAYPHHTCASTRAADPWSCAGTQAGPRTHRWDHGIPASTVHRALVRRGSTLRFMDGPRVALCARSPPPDPGELVHIDVKKLARIPVGGRQRTIGLMAGQPHQCEGAGYTDIHSAIDASSPLPDPEFAGPEKKSTRAWRFSSGARVLCRLRHHHRADPHRQRLRLSQQSVGTALRRPGIANTRTKPYHRPPTAKPSALTAPLRRMGVCALLRLRD